MVNNLLAMQFYSLQAINRLMWCPPTLRRAICLTQSTDSNTNVIQNTKWFCHFSSLRVGFFQGRWRRKFTEGIGFQGLPLWFSWQRICLQCGGPWVGKNPWRRERLLTPVFWPGEVHGLCSQWGRKESDTTERLSLSLSQDSKVGTEDRQCNEIASMWAGYTDRLPYDFAYSMTVMWKEERTRARSWSLGSSESRVPYPLPFGWLDSNHINISQLLAWSCCCRNAGFTAFFPAFHSCHWPEAFAQSPAFSVSWTGLSGWVSSRSSPIVRGTISDLLMSSFCLSCLGFP